MTPIERNRPRFLIGVPEDHVRERLKAAPGKELEGKFDSPESSAALAVNTFGWFTKSRASLLPPLPGMKPDVAASCVEVEYCARFPWRGGRHPWLDVIVETEHQLIGVESKRFEPYRRRKKTTFSEKYSEHKWDAGMLPYEKMRDALKFGRQRFEFLDAVQLVKHAFGLVTDGERKHKTPSLLYLFAEPAFWDGRPIPAEAFQKHRREIARFSERVEGASVGFHAISYREWLQSWPVAPDPIRAHRDAIIQYFGP